MKWYYIDENITEGDRRQGPFPVEKMQELANAGIVKDETLVWHSGMKSWITWRDVIEEEQRICLELIQNNLQALIKEKQAQKVYGNFFIRALAFLIDNFILGVIGGIIIAVLATLNVLDYSSVQNLATLYLNDPTSTEAFENFINAPGMKIFISIWSAVQALYFILFHFLRGATPGKIIFHLRVENEQGEKLSLLHSVLRYLASLFTGFTMALYGLGYLIACLDPKKRTLHDWIVKTFVVQVSKK